MNNPKTGVAWDCAQAERSGRPSRKGKLKPSAPIVRKNERRPAPPFEAALFEAAVFKAALFEAAVRREFVLY